MSILVQENIPLSRYSTLKTGGNARYLVEVNNHQELKAAVEFAHKLELAILVLGTGSNVLISDQGFSDLVIVNKMLGRQFTENSAGDVTLYCQSGEVLDDVIKDAVSRGYWGLENLSAIPGTIGALPVQNVGAYGVEAADFILHVETIDLTTGEEKKFLKKECEFGYRESFFKTNVGKNYFITAVSMQLKKTPSPKIDYADLKKIFVDKSPSLEEVRRAVIEIRSHKFPDWTVVGTAGSFFKNPIVSQYDADLLRKQYPDMPQYEAGPGFFKIPLGYVLDKVCNLKGYRRGPVGLFPEQALVLVNYGGATAEDIKNFAAEIAEKVFAKTRIVILPEVSFI